ncbi:MAG TPA: hypothetical protein VFO10_21160 [Oligoflexus sp.]|uniref:hypothetical protein n=1 Tax=Oligoflexus sp. TaxID=1971216 RepID=UPI002D7FA7D1|nr:hypothetical protein [Oligoflexus sp.]HET9239783.1 hypothetical protein [Oligoflexus sp.]
MSRSLWTFPEVTEIKKLIKAELDRKLQEVGVASKLEFILLRINQLSASETPTDGIRLFVYAMSALAHHERHGGLQSSQVKDLMQVAEATLKVFQVTPQKSKLAFLYGELAMISSQIHLKDGQFWKATWEQYVSIQLSGNQPPGGKQFVDLLFGIKYLRLGHGERALGYFHAAESSETSADVWMLARINRIRSLRLTGRFAEALSLNQETSGLPIDPNLQLELDWERCCCEVHQTQNLDELFKLVQKGSTHYRASYVLEFFLWALAAPTFQWLKKLPKIRTLLRDDSLELKEQGFYYPIVRDLERSYDEKVLLLTRLQLLGGILEKLNQCHSVDKQILILGAVSRWLHRNKIKELSGVILLEYVSLCTKVSQGRSSDLLGLMRDC